MSVLTYVSFVDKKDLSVGFAIHIPMSTMRHWHKKEQEEEKRRLERFERALAERNRREEQQRFERALEERNRREHEIFMRELREQQRREAVQEARERAQRQLRETGSGWKPFPPRS